MRARRRSPGACVAPGAASLALGSAHRLSTPPAGGAAPTLPTRSSLRRARRVAEHFLQVGHRERLAEEAREPGLGEAAGRLLVAVAAHQDDAGVGTNAADLAEHAVAGEARQGEVNDYRVDRARVRAKDVDALATVARLEHAAAEPLEHVRGHGAHVLLVVHQEHGALLAALAGGRRGDRGGRLDARGR